MALAKSNNSRLGGCPVDMRAVAMMIREQHPGISQALAETMAAGGLSWRPDAIAIARRWRLVRVDTDEARAKGLLQ